MAMTPLARVEAHASGGVGAALLHLRWAVFASAVAPSDVLLRSGTLATSVVGGDVRGLVALARGVVAERALRAVALEIRDRDLATPR